VKQLPEGQEWLYEMKFDGYRSLIIKDASRVQLQSRNHKNLTPMRGGSGPSDRFPGGIVDEPAELIKHGNGSLFNS
jgi:hypothetical protein